MVSQNEIATAREALEPMINRIKGLSQLYWIFTGAHQIAKTYAETFSE